MHGIKIKTISDNKITMNELIFKSVDETVSVNFTGQLSQSHIGRLNLFTRHTAGS